MSISNKSIVEKADIAVGNLTSGGLLNPMQANTFIRMLQEQPTILNRIRTVPMNGPRMEINKIGFAQRILQAAPAAGTALGSSGRSAPTTDKVTLITKEVIGEIHIPYDVLEDNIERGSLEDTIMALLAERASLDLEELIITGDTGNVGDSYLALVDGLLVQATSHVVDYTGDPVTTMDKSIFKHGIKAMPNKYLRNRGAMVFWTSPDVETEHADWLATRETSLGDQRVQADYTGRLTPFGIPIDAAALMPNDKYLLTYPMNVVTGVERSIMVETDRDIRARVLIVVMTMRLDVKFEEEDAVVKCIGLNPDGATT